jgi:hypothetical protein
MRDIAKLLFGSEGDILSGLSGLFAPGESDESGRARPADRAREWCGSTPGAGSVADAVRARAGGRAGGTGRPRGSGRAARGQ